MKNLNQKVSVAIPTFNSSKYILQCVKPILSSKFIDQIIISDDFSSYTEFEILKRNIEKIKYSTDKKIELFRNNENLGAFRNKYKCIDLCKNELIYQLDCDNIPQKNIDKVIEKIINIGETKYLYIPSKIYQFRKYQKTSKLMSNFNKKYVVKFSNEDDLVDLTKARDYYRNNTKYTIDKNLSWVLNLGNFFAYKSIYKMFNDHALNDENTPLALDAVAISYYYLQNKGSIKLLQNFSHFHRKRNDSVSFTSGDKSDESLKYFTNKFLSS